MNEKNKTKRVDKENQRKKKKKRREIRRMKENTPIEKKHE